MSTLETFVQNKDNQKHFSWGNILLLSFIAFMVLMAVMVYSAINTRFDLVSKDYYKDELRYQDKIDGVTNASTLSSIEVSQNTDALLIQLPKEMKGLSVQGSLWLYCKTDARNDKKLSLNVNENASQSILKAKIQKGIYQLKINWNVGAKPYYIEKEIVVL